jgi:transposase
MTKSIPKRAFASSPSDREIEMRKLLAQIKSRGENLYSYSGREGVSYQTLIYWRRRIDKLDSQRPSSFDGLAAIAQSILRQDPLSGHLFVFCNRRRDRLKVLYWDTSGFCILHKRLEQGTFSWPQEDLPGALEVASRELALVLAGVDLRDARRRRWYCKNPEK